MKKIVSILTSKSDINNNYVDAWLIPLKNFSCRSFFELDFFEIEEICRKTNKDIYLLCDKLVSQTELSSLVDVFPRIISICSKVFFQDLSFFNLGKIYDCLDKLVYYSPTLLVNYQDIEIYKSLGLKNFVLSKENTYSDYKEILSYHKDINLGMLCFGYPQIYYSKRKMISSFKKEYGLTFDEKKLAIKEKTRDFYQPIYEDSNGTFIFAGNIFFPYKQLNEFEQLGMVYFLVDSSFCEIDDVEKLVSLALDGNLDNQEYASTYLMFEKMVNDYGK